MDIERLLDEWLVADPHRAPGSDGCRGSGPVEPGKLDALMDRLLDPATRQARNLLLEKMVQTLAGVLLPDREQRDRLAHILTVFAYGVRHRRDLEYTLPKSMKA